MADIPGMVVTGVNAFENDEVNIHLMPQGADPTPSARPEQRARGRAWLRLDRMRTPGRISMVVIDGETGSPATRSGPNLHCPEASSRIRLPSRRRRLLSEEEAASLQFEVEEHPPALDRQALKDILAAQKEEERRVLGYHGTKDVWYYRSDISRSRRRQNVGQMGHWAWEVSREGPLSQWDTCCQAIVQSFRTRGGRVH